MGIVRMYDEEFSIDKRSKKGYDKVLKKLEPMVCDWARKVYFGDMPFEDRKQEIYVMAIQGIENYKEDKGVALSSFLHTHIRNKIISKIKSTNKKSNNATSYTTENTGYLQEIPLSSMAEGVEDSVTNDTSDISTFSNKSLLVEDLRRELGDFEMSVIHLLDMGYSVRAIAAEMDVKVGKINSAIKKIRKTKVISEYVR